MKTKTNLTHWADEEFVEKVLRGKGKPISKGFMKPNGFWLSVNGSWEEWLEGNWEGWLENKVCLKATLSDDINLFIIDSKQTFIDKFKELTNHNYHRLEMFSKYETINLFHNEIKKHYDGMWLKSEPFWRHRLDFNFMYFYGWDCESIVVWNREKISFKRMT